VARRAHVTYGATAFARLASDWYAEGVTRQPKSWLDEAAALPVAFAQVREDARLDAGVVDELPPWADVIMVASGGCTAAALAAGGRAGRIHIVDPNPAQTALARLKLALLGDGRRLALLGHAPMPPAERHRVLADIQQRLGLAPDVFGPPAFVADVGPDHAGRYERLFAALRDALAPQRGKLDALLRLSDLGEQARRAAPETPLGRALDAAYDDVLSLPNLVRLFGELATHNRREPFARHFLARTRHALATLPAADNPYLWQMLAGRFPEGVAYPWLAPSAPAELPAITWSVADMTTVLRQRPGTADFVHLSNILDWLPAGQARETLTAAAGALRPGGFVLIRQLNSTLDVPSLGADFTWDREAADELHRRDRSFFYRSLHLGVRR
jgi:S-adenosylmethionine-diacylglycerol 3-amino-3-carboxypropyl transferase